MPAVPTVLVMGGGGFSMEPENLALDAYVLERTGRDHPRIAFLAQASGEREEYIQRFHAAFSHLGAEASHVTLPPRTPSPHLARPVAPEVPTTPADVHQHLSGVDAIYVGGGSTLRMLHVWDDHGLPALLRSCWQAGTVIAGVSAGMICWFEHGITDSIPGSLTAMPGLGWLPGSACPHFDGEEERRPRFHTLVGEGAIPAGWAADDSCALRYEGTEVAEVISSRPEAAAYYVHAKEGHACERRVAARLLPAVAGVPS